MKKTLLVHGCWGGIAVIVFLIGGFRQPLTPNATALVQSSTSLFPMSAEQQAQASLTAGPREKNRKQTAEQFEPPNLEELARLSVSEPNPITRRLAFSRLLEAMTPDNALEIRKKLVAVGVESDQWRDFNYQWGALAGEEAFQFAADSKERDLSAALAGWASANPNQALAMLNNLPDDMRDQRDSLARSVVEGMSDRDLKGATELVLQLAGEGIKEAGELMGMVANDTVRAKGVEEAAAWSESLPDGPLKGRAMQRIANEYAEADPEAAAAWAEGMAHQDFAAQAVEEVSDKWAAKNPVEAVTWLESLPEGTGQKAGLNSVFGDWEDRDPAAATEYLASMPMSSQRDAAISGFSRGYAWQDPEVAIAWALDISDPQLRQESLTRAGQVFLRKDAESARAWLESSGLPSETQQAILDRRG